MDSSTQHFKIYLNGLRKISNDLKIIGTMPETLNRCLQNDSQKHHHFLQLSVPTCTWHVAQNEMMDGKRKGKVHPITGHEGPEEEQSFIFTLSLTSALDGGWVVNATLRPLYPRERPGTHCIGGWMGLRARLDECGISRPHWDSIPGPTSPQKFAVWTELSRHSRTR